MLVALFLLAASSANAGVSLVGPEPRLAVGWSVELGTEGRVRAMRTSAPFDWVTEEIPVGAEPRLRARRGRLFAVSASARTITMIRTRTWSVVRTFNLKEFGAPLDIAVASRREAYVTIEGRDALLRLDLETGAVEEAADLAALVEKDAVADPSGLELAGGRIFIQIRQLNAEDGTPREPSLLGVFDVAAQQLVDADPETEGVQGIRLAGTYAKMKMQTLHTKRLLFVSSSGAFFDNGGIEKISLDTLESQGLIVAEQDGHVGADLGAFAMLGEHRGYLVYSTDLLLSSHLHAFHDSAVDPTELHVLLDYFMPAIVLVRRTATLFVPDNSFGNAGVVAFRSSDGTRLTEDPTPTDAGPSDLEAIRGAP